MVGQEISKDNGHQYVHGRRITDDGRDLVTDCNDELSQSSPDDFSLPHGFLLCSTMCVRLQHCTVWNYYSQPGNLFRFDAERLRKRLARARHGERILIVSHGSARVRRHFFCISDISDLLLKTD